MAESLTKKVDQVAYDYETERVPENKTRPWWEIAFIWGGLCTAGFDLLVGALYAGSGLSWTKVALFLLIGNAIVVLMYTLVGSTGVKERLSAPYVAQRIFGKHGTVLYSVFLAFLIMGWGAVMLQLMGDGLAHWLGGTPKIWYIIATIAVGTTAVVGYKAIGALSDVVVPIFAIVTLPIGIKATLTVGWNNIWGISRPWGGHFTVLSGITFVVGLIALGASQSQAITRYAKRTADIPLAAGTALYWGHMLFPLLGAGIAVYVNSSDLYQLFGIMGGVGILLFFLTNWTTADNDFYYAGLAFTRVYPKWHKWRWTLLSMIIGLIYIYGDILGHIEQWISSLGTYIPPVAGMFVSEYYAIPRLGIYRPSCLEVKESVNLAGFITWIISAWLLYKNILLTKITPVDAMIYGFVIYTILGYIQFKIRGETNE